MVATSITSRSVIRSESCRTTFQRTPRSQMLERSMQSQRSWETMLGYPQRVIDVSAQLVTYVDASCANMEGSKSQCGVIVFLTHEPRRFLHGELQLGHLVYWTSSTIKRVVRSTLATEAYSVSEAVEEALWLRSVLAEMWPSVPCSLPRSLRTVRFLQPLPSCQIRQGNWIGQAAPNRDSNAETSLLWSTGSDTCVCHNSHDARRRLAEGFGSLPFVACGDERASLRVCYLRLQHRCEDNLADALRACINSQDGNWISADSISRIAIWKVWSEHSEPCGERRV